MIRSLDTETCLITEFDKAPPLVCVSMAGQDGSKVLYRYCDAREPIAKALTHDTLVGVNLAYDMAVICRQFPEFVPLVWQAYNDDRIRDVGIEQKLMDIADGERTERSYSLFTLMKQHFGVERDKTTYRLGFGALRDVPIDMYPEGAVKYCLDDAEDPLRLLTVIDGGRDKFTQARHAFWAYLMGVWGVRTDPVRVARLKAKLLSDRERVFQTLIKEGIIRENGSQDTKKTMERMVEICAARGVEPFLTPTGRIQISEERCRDSNDPVLELVAEYGSIRKQLSADIPNLERGEIHTKYDSLKVTGRMGSGGDDDTSPTGKASNLTNLPRSGGIRECYVPRPGKIFFDSDYSGLEAYTGAQACLWLVGESSLAGILNQGDDYHLHTTAAYLGCGYEEAVALYKAGDENTQVLRQFSKIFNYGLGGGMGMQRAHEHAQKELKKAGHRELAMSLTREQSNRLWVTWRRRYPEWQKYFDRTASLTADGGCQFEQLVSGRVRGVFGKSAYTEMNNGYFQGLGADAAKDAGWLIARECYDPTRDSVLLGSRIVIFGHDSFTGECDPEAGHDVAMRVKELMEGVSVTWTPDVPLKTEPCLSTCVSKKAKAVYDEHGRLVPWSPKE